MHTVVENHQPSSRCGRQVAQHSLPQNRRIERHGRGSSTKAAEDPRKGRYQRLFIFGVNPEDHAVNISVFQQVSRSEACFPDPRHPCQQASWDSRILLRQRKRGMNPIKQLLTTYVGHRWDRPNDSSPVALSYCPCKGRTIDQEKVMEVGDREGGVERVTRTPENLRDE